MFVKKIFAELFIKYKKKTIDLFPFPIKNKQFSKGYL